MYKQQIEENNDYVKPVCSTPHQQGPPEDQVQPRKKIQL